MFHTLSHCGKPFILGEENIHILRLWGGQTTKFIVVIFLWHSAVIVTVGSNYLVTCLLCEHTDSEANNCSNERHSGDMIFHLFDSNSLSSTYILLNLSLNRLPSSLPMNTVLQSVHTNCKQHYALKGLIKYTLKYCNSETDQYKLCKSVHGCKLVWLWKLRTGEWEGLNGSSEMFE